MRRLWRAIEILAWAAFFAFAALVLAFRFKHDTGLWVAPRGAAAIIMGAAIAGMHYTGMAAMLILLSAVDAGLGALFFGIPPDKIDTFHETFGVPRGLHPIGTIAIGYAMERDRPSPSLQRGHRPPSEVIHRGRW